MNQICVYCLLLCCSCFVCIYLLPTTLKCEIIFKKHISKYDMILLTQGSQLSVCARIFFFRSFYLFSLFIASLILFICFACEFLCASCPLNLLYFQKYPHSVTLIFSFRWQGSCRVWNTGKIHEKVMEYFWNKNFV